jgi:hypothetical protein
VAGVYADLRGRFLYVEKPRIAVWAGTAVYRIFGGLIRVRIPEGGVVMAERLPAGTRLSHDVYMDFPNSVWGKILTWIFRNILKGPQAVYTHTFKELMFFKEQLEKEQPAQKKEVHCPAEDECLREQQDEKLARSVIERGRRHEDYESREEAGIDVQVSQFLLRRGLLKD